MMRLLALFVITAMSMHAATAVSGSVVDPTSTAANGNATIKISVPCISDASKLVTGSTLIEVSSGSLAVTLEPNTGGCSDTYYNVSFSVAGISWKETWVVPDQATATLSEVRSDVPSSARTSVSLSWITGCNALGDVLYYNGSNVTYLAGSTSATKMYLSQTGTGSVSAAPAWGSIDTLGTIGTGVWNGTVIDEDYLDLAWGAAKHLTWGGDVGIDRRKAGQLRITDGSTGLGDFYAKSVGLDSIAGGEQRAFFFFDAGVAKWTVGKATTNALQIYDNINTANRMLIGTTGEITLSPASLLTVSGAIAATPSFVAGRVAVTGASSQPTSANLTSWDASGRVVDSTVAVANLITRSASVSATAQNAAITTTNLLAAAAAGTYRVAGYLHTTTASDGACTSALTIGYTYNSGAKTLTPITGHSHAVDETASQGTAILRNDASANITYAVDLTAGGGDCTNAVFALYVTLERLQ